MIVGSPSVPAALGVPLAPTDAADPVGTAERPRPHWPGRHVTLAGTRVHVRETPGPGPGAPAAVYVHGLGGSATNWTELAGALGGHWHGLAVDLPGFGRSEPPARGDYSLAAHAAVVVEVVERAAAERGPVHLLGNSLGGAVALLVAAARPDLVATLTLVSPAVPDLRPSPSRLGDARMILSAVPVVGARARRDLAAEDPRTRLARTMRLCWAEPDAVSPAAFDLAAGEALERAGLPWVADALHHSFLGLLRVWLTRGEGSLWAAAAAVRVPALVVWGEADRLIAPRLAARTAAALPAGRELRLPGVGHVAQMERPALVARAVLGLAAAAAAGTWAGAAVPPAPRAPATRTPRAARPWRRSVGRRPVGAATATPDVGARTVGACAPEPRSAYGTVPG